MLRKLFLWLFVESKSRQHADQVLADRKTMSTRRKAAASSAAEGHFGQPPSEDREALIMQALNVRADKEHLWNELSEEEREKLLEQLGDGTKAMIQQMKAQEKS